MKTLQQIFDEGLAHIRKQGGPCHLAVPEPVLDDGYRPVMTLVGNCAYRNGQGQACIVGGLIADADYDPAWDENDGTPAAELAKSDEGRKALLNAGIDVTQSDVINLLSRMQGAHDIGPDDYIGPDNYMYQFELAMRNVAKIEGLTYTEPK